MTLGHVQQKTGAITQLWQHDSEQGVFRDVTLAAGLNPNNGDCHGAVWSDIDRDGDLDLYIAKGSPKKHVYSRINYNELWINQGQGQFINQAEAAGVRAIGRRSRGAYSLDVDGDGQTDLYSMSWRRTHRDLGNALYQNQGRLQFVDIAPALGVDRPGEPTYQDRYRVPGNRTAAWADFNGDSLPDVLLMQPVALLAQTATGFTDVTAAAGIQATGDAGGAAWGDSDNDGDLDLYITRRSANRGFFYVNRGDGTFQEETSMSGIDNAEEAWAAVWGDYDNDGDLDLYIVNSRNSGRANRLYRNDGDNLFEDVTDGSGIEAQVPGAGIDATFVDYDDDGALDIFVTNGSGTRVGPYVLLRNLGNSNHFLKFRFRGRRSNRDALMVKVRIRTDEGVQYRQHHGPTHGFAQDNTPLHFGVGTARRVEKVWIEWPAGTRQILTNVPVDRTVRIVEPRVQDAELLGEGVFWPFGS